MKGVAGAESKALPTVLREMNLHLMRVDSTKNLIFLSFDRIILGFEEKKKKKQKM
jgi:hypothetical protein